MKKFITTLVSFTIFTIFFYSVFIILWGRYAPSSLKPNLNYRVGTYGFTNTRLKDVKKTKNIDILFIGSSHSYRGFDTRIFKQNNYNTFNLGTSSQSPIQSLVLLKRYLDQVKPKAVIFEVTPVTFSSDGTEASLDLIANDRNDIFSYQMALEVNSPRTYNTLLYSIHRDFLHLNDDYIEPLKTKVDTYISGGFVEKKISFYKPVPIEKTEIILQNSQLKAFQDCVNEIRKRNIELILVNAPVTHNLYSSYTNPEYFDNTMKKFGDFYNFNKIAKLSDTLDFYDSHHLNQNGVEIFNSKLIEILKKQYKTLESSN